MAKSSAAAAAEKVKIPFRKRETSPNDREVIGTIKSLMPKGTKVSVQQRNFANPNVRVMLTLITNDGDEYTVLLSKTVSSMLRNGEISLNHIITLPVAENEVKDKNGTMSTVHVVGLPEGYSGPTQEFDLDKVKSKELEIPEDVEFLDEDFVFDA